MLLRHARPGIARLEIMGILRPMRVLHYALICGALTLCLQFIACMLCVVLSPGYPEMTTRYSDLSTNIKWGEGKRLGREGIIILAPPTFIWSQTDSPPPESTDVSQNDELVNYIHRLRDGGGRSMLVDRFGWPVPWIEYAIRGTTGSAVVVDGGVASKYGAKGSPMLSHRVLPAIPKWRRAIVCWLWILPFTVSVLVAHRAVRVGVRGLRGLCVNCGYRFEGAPVCPECGQVGVR